jgi:hypothetical protein
MANRSVWIRDGLIEQPAGQAVAHKAIHESAQMSTNQAFS